MRVVVTGASGFCGRRYVEFLKTQGHKVYSISRRPEGDLSSSLPLTNLRDEKSLSEFFTRVRPDRLVHLAGLSRGGDPQSFHEVNVVYATTLLKALDHAKCNDTRVLFVGSGAEYGEISPQDIPIAETLECRPFSDYGRTKLLQTRLGLDAARAGRWLCVVRPFNIIGPGMPPYIALQNFINQIREVLKGTGETRLRVGNLSAVRDFVDVDDFVTISFRLLEKENSRGEVINICSGKGTSIESLLHILIEQTGLNIEIEQDPKLMKPIDIPVHVGDTKKLYAILDQVVQWTPISTTIRKSFETI